VAPAAAADLFIVTVLAVAVAAFPVAAHLASQVAGVLICGFMAFLLANYATAAVPAVLVFAYLFQNLFVSLVSPWIVDAEQFNTIRAYTFVLTTAVWGVLAIDFWMKRGWFAADIRRLMRWSSMALGLIAVYLAIGLASDPKSAVVYVRNVATPFLILQACLIATARSGADVLRPLTPLACGALIYGYAELLFRERLFALMNAERFMALRMSDMSNAGEWVTLMHETGLVIRSFTDTLVVDFLNTPLLADLGITATRLLGPNLHSISYAYALCAFALLFLATGRLVLFLCVIPLLLVIGSKGALVCLGLSAMALAASRVFPPRPVFWGFAAALGLYAAAALLIGRATGDYHVLGFLSGVHEFLRNPFGHGLGAGGNLSMNMTTIDWSRSQALGKTDHPVESAVGVLLYQMGFAGLVLCWINARIAWTVWIASLANGSALLKVLAFGLLATTVNGVFQEEALFAPLALGLMMAFAGIVLAQARPAAESDIWGCAGPRSARSPRPSLRAAVSRGRSS
jgi:hypothetical protein